MEALEQLTLFTEASLNDPAKTSQSQASKRDCRENVPASGMRCLESFPNSDPLMFLLKTCVERSISPCLPSSPVWKEKATKCGQASYQLLHLERRTKGKDCSLSESGGMWPTSRASDCNGASRKRVLNAEGKAEGRWQLREAVLAFGLLHPSTETTTAAD